MGGCIISGRFAQGSVVVYYPLALAMIVAVCSLQVVAFAMKEYRMPLKDALAYVKGKRSVVNPNDGFLSQLRDYEGILRARYGMAPLLLAPNTCMLLYICLDLVL